MDIEQEKWTCTDIDNLQYGRHIKDNVFEFKELCKFENLEVEVGEYIQMQINLDDFSKEEIEEHISAYGYKYSEGTDRDNKLFSDWPWIFAECIFEQLSGQY